MSTIMEMLEREQARQKEVINLIASENLPSENVRMACGHLVNDKYAEGYPGKRWYGGCEIADEIEARTIELAKDLFKADHANVQPHSGSQANQAVYFAIMRPLDTILALDLTAGGHLSHGSKVNFSNTIYKTYHYGVSSNGFVDYNEMEYLAKKVRPKLLIGGGSSYPRSFDWERISYIAKRVGAYFLADVAHPAGLIAAELYPSPVEHADFVTFTTQKTMRGPRGGVILCKEKYKTNIDRSLFPGLQGGPNIANIAAKGICFEEGFTDEYKEYQRKVLENAKVMADILGEKFELITGGTNTHLFVVKFDDITGAKAQQILEDNGIMVNKQVIPDEPRPVHHTSGIRIGTPFITSQGWTKEKCAELATRIAALLEPAVKEARESR